MATKYAHFIYCSRGHINRIIALLYSCLYPVFNSELITQKKNARINLFK